MHFNKPEACPGDPGASQPLAPPRKRTAHLAQRLRARAVVLQLRAQQPLEQLALPRARLLAAGRLLRRRSAVRLQRGHLGHAHACMGRWLFLLP